MDQGKEVCGIHFSDRELCLLDNCKQYSENDPAGLPGHNLMILVAKLQQVIKELKSQKVYVVVNGQVHSAWSGREEARKREDYLNRRTRGNWRTEELSVYDEYLDSEHAVRDLLGKR